MFFGQFLIFRHGLNWEEHLVVGNINYTKPKEVKKARKGAKFTEDDLREMIQVCWFSSSRKFFSGLGFLAIFLF